MTDKPIIINGVDVSGCEHLGLYKEYKLKCGSCCPIDCSDNPNCYYKQLMRKEQECEKLKKKKEENTTFYLKKYANKDSECLELQHNINVLKQTLTEIKEICKFNFTITTTNLLAKTILQKISECEVEND